MSLRLPVPGHVDFETRARLSAHFLNNMIDPLTAMPFFSVVDLAPTRALHDWPDFVDMAARHFEAALLARDMTGDAPESFDKLCHVFTRTFDKETGLFYRPCTAISTHCADLFDQTRALCTLATWIMADEDDLPRDLARRMIQGLLRASRQDGKVRVFNAGLAGHRSGADDTAAYGAAPMIRPLVKLAHLLESDEALDLAEGVTRLVLERSDTFTADGAFRDHTHSRLATAAGFFAVGEAAGHTEWCDLAYRAWQYARGLGASFGLVPEFAGAEQSPTTCETCALMDYMDLMILLAQGGRVELWDEIDRLLRNHLIESQYVRKDWGRAGTPHPRADLYIEDRVPERMVGGFAGWSSATQLFGMTPKSSAAWVVPTADASLYVDVPRVAQNCCGGSGLKALYLAWSHAVEQRDGAWRVNLLTSRAVPGLRVEAPVPGDVRLTADDRARVALRLPEGVCADDVRVNDALSHSVDGRDLLLELTPGCEARVAFDPPRTTVTDTLRHGTYPDETLTCRYLGPSVVEMTSANGPSVEDWKQVCGLYGQVPLYAGRSEGLATPEPKPTCRNARVVW